MQSLLGLCKRLLPFQIPTSPLSCQARGQRVGLAGAQLALLNLSSLSCVLPWPRLGFCWALSGHTLCRLLGWGRDGKSGPLLQSALDQEEEGAGR